jgi:ribonuclease HI
VAQFDGGIRGGNPGGQPTYGVSFTCKDKIIHECSGIITDPDLPLTNNVAEWMGMKAALMYAYMWKEDWKELEIRGDSQLVINQMSGVYAVNSDHLKPIHASCLKIYEALRFKGNVVRFKWNRRDKNKRADLLAGKAYDVYEGVDATVIDI